MTCPAPAPAPAPTPATAVLDQLREERLARIREHAEQCVLLAVVTTTDVAASLIDRALELQRMLPAVV